MELTTAKNLMNFGQGTLSWQPILWRKTATVLHTLPLLSVMAFYKGQEYRNADYCIDIQDDSSISITNCVYFGPVTTEILPIICMGGWVHKWPKYARFGYLQQNAWIVFAKLSENIEG